MSTKHRQQPNLQDCTRLVCCSFVDCVLASHQYQHMIAEQLSPHLSNCHLHSLLVPTTLRLVPKDLIYDRICRHKGLCVHCTKSWSCRGWSAWAWCQYLILFLFLPTDHVGCVCGGIWSADREDARGQHENLRTWYACGGAIVILDWMKSVWVRHTNRCIHRHACTGTHAYTNTHAYTTTCSTYIHTHVHMR